MAKRRLSKQQQRRIAENQKSKIEKDQLKSGLATDNETDETNSQTARVISHHGRQLFAETESLERVKCKIRQNLGDIACGDYIVIQQETDPGGLQQNVVVAIKERSNMLVKTGFAGAIKPVAANIDQVVIVTSLKPKPNPYLIDRYLAATENLPSKALIIINKIDLLDGIEQEQESKKQESEKQASEKPESKKHELQKLVDDLTALYQSIGYRVICASMEKNIGIAEISEALGSATSILVGLSGVGKSSIVKKILPLEEIKIGETSTATGEGKHTTTVSAFYHLDNDGIIIDSPGVRDFTPSSDSIEEITNGFIDVRKFNGACKFTNCSHTNEPGCAMKQAVSDGHLNTLRFKNYLRMIEDFLNPK